VKSGDPRWFCSHQASIENLMSHRQSSFLNRIQ